MEKTPGRVYTSIAAARTCTSFIFSLFLHVWKNLARLCGPKEVLKWTRLVGVAQLYKESGRDEALCCKNVRISESCIEFPEDFAFWPGFSNKKTSSRARARP